MRLKQKQFIPFMIVVAIITLAIIVITSFNFSNKQEQQFKENVASSDSLHIMPLSIIGEAESITIESLEGKNALLVFWASWSEKSESMLNEIQSFQSESDSLSVIAGLVKDAEESLPAEKKYPSFTYVDGTDLFNELKAPGYPSYILFDADGNVLHTHIGFQKGAGYDTLKIYLQ
ncbi:MAG: hypothetical protein WD059_14520 [Balneolaceae bacterium]